MDVEPVAKSSNVVKCRLIKLSIPVRAIRRINILVENN